MGSEAFSAALKVYFNKFAFKNATIDDFIGIMDIELAKRNFGFTLKDWKLDWICKAGLNQCEVHFDPKQ